MIEPLADMLPIGRKKWINTANNNEEWIKIFGICQVKRLSEVLLNEKWEENKLWKRVLHYLNVIQTNFVWKLFVQMILEF